MDTRKRTVQLALPLAVFVLGGIGCRSLASPQGGGAAGGCPAAEPAGTLVVDLGTGVMMEFVLLPSGRFMMGTEGRGCDTPRHEVTITRPFYLGKYEVTQEQWQAVMGTNPSEFEGAKNPVENVSWEDCQGFLARLWEKVRGPAFRLPTEAEWEYACRAGSTTAYSWGDDEAGLPDYAWFDGNAEWSTHPVGEKQPNAWGLFDMHGNVWEWCADWYDDGYYAKSPLLDPAGPTTGSLRVQRGGGWGWGPGGLRSECRVGMVPTTSYCANGFRVARGLP